MAQFKGRVVLGGDLTGTALVSKQGVNTLATFLIGLWSGSKTVGDQDNPDIYGKVIAGQILCLPTTIGSTTGGMVLQCAAVDGIAPSAMLYSEAIDTVSSAGIILANIWNNKKIIAIDQLGDSFLEAVKTGDSVKISSDGTVVVTAQPKGGNLI